MTYQLVSHFKSTLLYFQLLQISELTTTVSITGWSMLPQPSSVPSPSVTDETLFFSQATHHVDLVADQHLDDVGAVGVRLQLVEPHVQLGETDAAGDVVDEDDALSAAVVARGQRAESLLAGRVLSTIGGGGRGGRGVLSRRQDMIINGIGNANSNFL